jgi:DNA-binding MarR family transcriptional regulator
MSGTLADMDTQQMAGPMTVPQALGRLRVALDDAYTRASRELGLTAQQAELLCAALRPAAVGDLARALRCDRSNISRLVDRAAKRDLLRRRGGEDDGRVTIIELSPQGRRLAEAFIARLESMTQTLIAGWTAAREGAAVEIMNDLARAMDAAGERDQDAPAARSA